MKKIYTIITIGVVMLVAAPMAQEEALALFEKIRTSEYNWAVRQWEKEMKIKVHSRSSRRKSIWQENHELLPTETKSNEGLRTVGVPTPTVVTATPVVTTVTTTLPPITNITSSVPSIP